MITKAGREKDLRSLGAQHQLKLMFSANFLSSRNRRGYSHCYPSFTQLF